MSEVRGPCAPIVFSPNRARLAAYALLYLALGPPLTALGLEFLSALLPPYRLATLPQALFVAILGVGVLLGGALICVLVPLTLYRIVVSRPSVIVSAEGISDGCSLVVGGMGLLRWSEIEAIIPSIFRRRLEYVVIMPRDPKRVLARRGPLPRLFRRALNMFLPGAIGLPQWLLAEPVEEVYARIIAEYGDMLRAHDIVFAPATATAR
ncbi:MAG TPA: hypothetical protein VF808_20200 [Ktedonobacterales bacterium]